MMPAFELWQWRMSGLIFLMSPRMRSQADIIAHGEISDQFGNGNERRVLVHFGDCVAIVVIHSAGSVGDGHIEFAVVDAVDNIHDVTSAAAHGFLDDKQPFPLLHGRAPTPLLFQAF